MTKKSLAPEYDVPEFTITQIIDAPMDLVWQMCSQPHHMKRWWGPKGTIAMYAKMDFKVGGSFHYRLRTPEGKNIWGKMAFKEIVEPTRLVFLNALSDESGGLSRHPTSPNWPREMLSTFMLEPSDGKTQITVKWQPINATPEEIATFNEGREGMRLAWTGSFDRLAGYLMSLQDTGRQKISPFLWFHDKAEEAAQFYVSVFNNSEIIDVTRYNEESAAASGRPAGSIMTVSFLLDGQEFTALNGGPEFKFSPAISFFIYCRSERELDNLYDSLTEGGDVLMPRGRYPFSERYAFVKDKYGVSWQLMLSPHRHHIVPCLLFVGEDFGKAEAAVWFYTTVFKHGTIDHIIYYQKGEEGQEGTVKHSSFLLEGQEFIAMDGAGEHNFSFNESTSFVVNCETQEEIDHLWNKLTEEGQESECGWLKDKYGVSWQIVPSALGEMMSDKDNGKSGRVTAAMLKMKKLDIDALKKAYEGG
jgi:predicted 3-demethylubiquinone-9 3-methyltransferase (glyoxalase superfamily)/uncharacterized protein YndB with AHSA1/START domain